MYKYIFTAVILFFYSVLPAQTRFLDNNNVKAGVSSGGTLFSNQTTIAQFGNGLFESPRNSGKAAIFTQALWMAGLDAHDSLHVAAQRFFENGVDYFNGPIIDSFTTAERNYYDAVFPVLATEVFSFQHLFFPVTSTQVPADILYWPAKGNASVLSRYGINITSDLAPFVDVNNNGIYEPLLGDYPANCEADALFFVFNDLDGAHSETRGVPLGIEVRGMATAYTPRYASNPINNAIFVQYEIENKSSNNYSSFYFGNWVDPDLGCYSNDYAGCDSSKNLMFCYNASSNDPDCGAFNGYAGFPIAVGVKSLNQPMNVFGSFSNPGDSNMIDPETPLQYSNYLKGLWNDGTPFTYGKTGYNRGSTDTTKYMFTGDPNNAAEWSERHPQGGVNIAPADVRIYASTGPFTFNTGEIKRFDYVFFTSFDSFSNNTGIVDTLKRDGDSLQAFYNNFIQPCQPMLPTGIRQTPALSTISIYPNPANNQVTISSSEIIKSLDLMDIQGRVLVTQIVGIKSLTVPVSNLAKGVYLVNIQYVGGTVVRRIVVE